MVQRYLGFETDYSIQAGWGKSDVQQFAHRYAKESYSVPWEPIAHHEAHAMALVRAGPQESMLASHHTIGTLRVTSTGWTCTETAGTRFQTHSKQTR